MGRMLGRRGWVFHQDKNLIGNTAETFYLATSVEDMLDTWGGSISLEEVVEPAGLFLSVGGGLLSQSNRPAEDLTWLKMENFVATGPLDWVYPCTVES